MTKKIYRSESDRMIAGVCGGIGEYFDIDPTIVRIIFAFILLSGGGLILYIILWIVIPTESRVNKEKEYTKQDNNKKNSKPSNVVQFDTKKEEKK
jgi:phage shock protein PspC (stress-responsive transcriptional regulator)